MCALRPGGITGHDRSRGATRCQATLHMPITFGPPTQGDHRSRHYVAFYKEHLPPIPSILYFIDHTHRWRRELIVSVPREVIAHAPRRTDFFHKAAARSVVLHPPYLPRAHSHQRPTHCRN